MRRFKAFALASLILAFVSGLVWQFGPFQAVFAVANLSDPKKLMPQELNRRKSNRVGERQVAHAEKLFAAGLITPESLKRVKARAGR